MVFFFLLAINEKTDLPIKRKNISLCLMDFVFWANYVVLISLSSDSSVLLNPIYKS